MQGYRPFRPHINEPEQQKWKTEDSVLTKIQNSYTASRGNVQFITIKSRGWYITDQFPVNPQQLNTFRFLFDIKAFEPGTTDFSVTVTFRDFNHKPLAWRRKGWHYDYPIAHKIPSGLYETIVIEFPHKQIDIKQIPSQARFIQFGVLINHGKGSTAYGLSEYLVHQKF